MKDFITGFFSGASGKLRMAVCAVILSALIVRFPVLTGWLGKDIQDSIFKFADEVKSWGWGFVMLFCKQWNVTGGTVETTSETKVVKDAQ